MNVQADQFDIDAEVRSAIPQMMEKVREKLHRRMESIAENVAMEELGKAVRQWVIDEMVPEIRAQLDAGKSGFISKAKDIAETIGKQMGDALSESAAKTLSNSHVIREISEKLFRGY